MTAVPMEKAPGKVHTAFASSTLLVLAGPELWASEEVLSLLHPACASAPPGCMIWTDEIALEGVTTLRGVYEGWAFCVWVSVQC